MLDFRLQTFLVLCRIRSYTKTAEALNITQPTVTQHIQHLEQEFGGKLFSYSGRMLSLTPRGETLYRYGIALEASVDRVRQSLQSQARQLDITYGATLTIAEYVMPPIISKLLHDQPDTSLTMQVGNTRYLLECLENGEISFAFLEGHFDKSNYQWRLFQRAPFIGVCSPRSELARRRVSWSQLLDTRLVLREEGSGSRDILEQILYEHSYTIHSFAGFSELGNINAIKEVVAQGLGITFLYRAAVEKELENGTLHCLDLEGFPVYREFNFVYLQGDLNEDEHLAWYRRFADYHSEGGPAAPAFPIHDG